LEAYGKKVLFVLSDKQETFVKSARNINKVVVKKFDQTSTTDVMNAKVLIIEAKACDGLGKVYC
jgi:ribosomal protein L4